MQLYWQRYVIRYSAHDQIQLINFFGSSGREMKQKIEIMSRVAWIKTTAYFKQHPWAILLIAGGLALVITLIKSRIDWEFPFWNRNRVSLGGQLYQKMLDRLERQGIMKKTQWTHREFIDPPPPLPQETLNVVKKITDYYEQSRFGARSFHRDKASQMLESLKNL